MRLALTLLVLCTLAPACSRDGATPRPAAPAAATSAGMSATVGGATLQLTTLQVSTLNQAVAERYGIERARDGALLLVTVRDAAGNGIDAGDLRLQATAGTLADAPAPLELREIRNGELTDYIGIFPAAPPATVQFRITATRAGARADLSTTAELVPR